MTLIFSKRFLTFFTHVNNLLLQITQAHSQQQVDELEKIVRELLITSATDFSLQLKLIDAIQRLGVAYHFEREIEKALERMHATFDGDHGNDDVDLYTVALAFRLLRQHGYNVSCGRCKQINLIDYLILSYY